MLPQTPIHQTRMISTEWALKACQAGDPQTFTISAGPCSQAMPQGLQHQRPTHTISVSLGCAPQGCTDLHDLHSTRPCPQGLPSHEPQTFTISAGLHPQACTGLHDLHWVAPLTPAQACMISARTMLPKPAKLAIHRHAGSPLCWSVLFRHTRPTLQRPTTLPWKASTCRPVGPHPPATHHRRTPNLPKRHTQTGLNVRRVASQQLGLNSTVPELY
jgi:hypothetical protein